MLKRSFRLRTKQDFKRVYTKGKTLNTRFFRIKTVPNDLEYSRVGVVLSNKVIKKAAKRNRRKRQMREGLRTLFPFLKKGYDVVVIAQPAAAEVSYASMLEDMREGLRKIGFIK